MSFSPTQPNIGVSSWALHAELGAPPFFGVASGHTIPESKPGLMSLLDMPGELARRGFQSLHICHFHLPTLDAGYLSELKGAIQNAGLTLHTLLIDDGDITHPTIGERDAEWVKSWLPIAAALGAENVRVIAGKTAGPNALERSAAVLNEVVRLGEDSGVHVLIENWFDVLSTPQAVFELLERTGGRVELLLDFGNWSGADKYEKLAEIAPRASACHAKSELSESLVLDEADYAACLHLPYPQGFAGPYILVNGGLAGIQVNRAFILSAAG